MKSLYTEHLVLRKWEETDEAALIALAKQSHIEYWLPDFREYHKHAHSWIKSARENAEKDNPREGFLSWAITHGVENKLIGCIGLGSFTARGEQEVECCYFMDADFCGKGYATEALKAVAEYAFGVIDLAYIVAAVQPLNVSSVRVAEKAGFTMQNEFQWQAPGREATLPFHYYRLERPRKLEEMAAFFNERVEDYDVHMLGLLKLEEFYQKIDSCLQDREIHRLLDLGCGTGLELERIFVRNPRLSVTGIDLSQGMLDKLAQKFPDKNLHLLCGSYFDVDFGAEIYDCALSTYSLHHFPEEEKQVLYQKIHQALKPGGFFLFGDYTVETQAQQDALEQENQRLRRENQIETGFYHFDTPFTVENEIRLLQGAGFSPVEIVEQWESASILVAVKE